MAYHARLGPSSAHRWRACTASPNASDGLPNEGNDQSRMGTACHGVSAECLLHDLDPSEFLGRKFLFCIHDGTGDRVEDFADRIHLDGPEVIDVHHEVEIKQEHVDWVRAYVDFVHELVEKTGGTLLVEQRVPIGHITGEEGAGGTSDVIILAGDTIYVVDAKFGRIKVTAYDILRAAIKDLFSDETLPPVTAPNDQLALYAGGALEAHGLFGDFKYAKLIIVQPPLGNVSEYTLPVSELMEHLDGVRTDAEATRSNPTFKAGDHCTWCPARVNCTARDAFVIETALEGFDDIADPGQIAAAKPKAYPGTMLGALHDKLPVIKSWMDDILTRLYAAVTAGERVVNGQGLAFKLVEGKKGARQWTDEAAVEDMLKSRMRLRDDQMYDRKLISPTTAEELAKPVKTGRGKKAVIVTPAVLGERQWNTLQALISQSSGKPALALEDDPRPAVPGVLDGFDSDSQPPADEVDLFN